jgi:hypothetical protein
MTLGNTVAAVTSDRTVSAVTSGHCCSSDLGSHCCSSDLGSHCCSSDLGTLLQQWPRIALLQQWPRIALLQQWPRIALLQQWPRIALLQQWPWTPLLHLLFPCTSMYTDIQQVHKSDSRQFNWLLCYSPSPSAHPLAPSRPGNECTQLLRPATSKRTSVQPAGENRHKMFDPIKRRQVTYFLRSKFCRPERFYSQNRWCQIKSDAIRYLKFTSNLHRATHGNSTEHRQGSVTNIKNSVSSSNYASQYVVYACWINYYWYFGTRLSFVCTPFHTTCPNIASIRSNF